MDLTTIRELSPKEKREIRKLVISGCANYDRHYGCLLLECECYMFGKWWTGAFCRYFENAVLPLNAELERSLKEVPFSQKQKSCPVCGSLFAPITSQAYCSDMCRKTGQREDARKRQAKWRKSRGRV